MTRTLVLGVDPGVSGALAFYEPALDPSLVNAASVFDLPTIKAKRGSFAFDIDTQQLMAIVHTARDAGFAISHAVVEQVTSRPRQGGQFSFGVNYGRVLGALESMNVRIVHAQPSKWKSHMGLRGEDKSQSVALAGALFPHMKPQLFGARGGALDGRAEALLLAYYGKNL